MKAHDTAELFFEDVRLPKTALLGGLNKGFYHLMTELPQERLQIGITGEFSSDFISCSRHQKTKFTNSESLIFFVV